MNVFFHIGLVKTGSTFIQSAVLDKVGDELCVIRPTSGLTNAAAFRGSNGILISNENLAGNPISQLNNNEALFDEFRRCIDTSIAFFNSPKIIMGFRAPEKFVNSLYKQYLQERGTKKWDEFLSCYQSRIGDLDFSRFIYYLRERFCESDLFLYSQEELRRSTPDVTNSLKAFIGVAAGPKGLDIGVTEVNRSLPERYEPVIRFLNRQSWRLHKVSGRHLGFRIGGLGINPAWICCRLLPQVFGRGNAERDLSPLERRYAKSWKCAREEIRGNMQFHLNKASRYGY